MTLLNASSPKSKSQAIDRGFGGRLVLIVTHTNVVILSLRRISVVLRWFRAWRLKKRFFTSFRMTANLEDVRNE